MKLNHSLIRRICKAKTQTVQLNTLHLIFNLFLKVQNLFSHGCFLFYSSVCAVLMLMCSDNISLLLKSMNIWLSYSATPTWELHQARMLRWFWNKSLQRLNNNLWSKTLYLWQKKKRRLISTDNYKLSCLSCMPNNNLLWFQPLPSATFLLPKRIEATLITHYVNQLIIKENLFQHLF